MQIKTALQNANTVAIISHRNPDADTVGSNLALREILERWGKKVTSACVDPVPSELEFLSTISAFQQEFVLKDIDIIVCVDISGTTQTVFLERYSDIFKKKIPIINIDHHRSNSLYGTINLVLPDCAATTLIMYRLFKIWDEKISKKMATALLCGLYFDTGSFMHSNTCDQVYMAGGELLELGAEINLIVKNLFRTHGIEKLKIWGKILSEIKQTDKNVVFSVIRPSRSEANIEPSRHDGTSLTEKDSTWQRAKSSLTSGVVDYLSMAKDNLFAALLAEDNSGNIRGSLRARNDDIDLSEIAAAFGGGGHKKASGFCIPGRLKKETVWKIEPYTENTL